MSRRTHKVEDLLLARLHINNSDSIERAPVSRLSAPLGIKNGLFQAHPRTPVQAPGLDDARLQPAQIRVSIKTFSIEHRPSV